METILIIIVALVGLSLIALPVKMAAAAMDAKRTGTFWCLIALAGASIMHGLGLTVPVFGTIIAFILSAIVFAAILGTGFFGGIGIAILHIIFSALLAGVIVLLFGVSLAGLLSELPAGLHQLESLMALVASFSFC
ncbi:MAG: hypothetical protein K8R77_16925 [Anaerolineaceae bacterium]|nr:hypothetical protein [Anaerolineaceae bacterium]